MKLLLASTLVLATACMVAGSDFPDWLYPRHICPRSTFSRDCRLIRGNCNLDTDCQPNAACCDQWGCGFGRCTRMTRPTYDWQKNRPGTCPRSTTYMNCATLTETCDYDWECQRQDGRAASCCDQWGCNIGRCTNSF